MSLSCSVFYIDFKHGYCSSLIEICALTPYFKNKKNPLIPCCLSSVIFYIPGNTLIYTPGTAVINILGRSKSSQLTIQFSKHRVERWFNN